MSAWRDLHARAAAGLSVVLALVLADPASAAHRARAAAGAAAAGKPPVLVELFTAQGCAACPQANALLGELASKPGIVALTFAVDYWDYLGWADTFAKPPFADRQRAYVSKLRLKEVYTPEMVVMGRREARGFDRAKVTDLIDDAARAPRRRGPRARLLAKDADGRPARVSVGPGAGSGEVWLVRYDPAERTVKVAAGENKGKTVVEENVVRDLVRLGAWSGHAKRFTVPKPDAAPVAAPAHAAGKPPEAAPAAAPTPLASVVIVQGAKGGPVLSVTPL